MARNPKRLLAVSSTETDQGMELNDEGDCLVTLFVVLRQQFGLCWYRLSTGDAYKALSNLRDDVKLALKLDEDKLRGLQSMSKDDAMQAFLALRPAVVQASAAVLPSLTPAPSSEQDKPVHVEEKRAFVSDPPRTMMDARNRQLESDAGATRLQLELVHVLKKAVSTVEKSSPTDPRRGESPASQDAEEPVGVVPSEIEVSVLSTRGFAAQLQQNLRECFTAGQSMFDNFNKWGLKSLRDVVDPVSRLLLPHAKLSAKVDGSLGNHNDFEVDSGQAPVSWIPEYYHTLTVYIKYLLKQPLVDLTKHPIPTDQLSSPLIPVLEKGHSLVCFDHDSVITNFLYKWCKGHDGKRRVFKGRELFPTMVLPPICVGDPSREQQKFPPERVPMCGSEMRMYLSAYQSKQPMFFNDVGSESPNSSERAGPNSMAGWTISDETKITIKWVNYECLTDTDLPKVLDLLEEKSFRMLPLDVLQSNVFKHKSNAVNANRIGGRGQSGLSHERQQTHQNWRKYELRDIKIACGLLAGTDMFLLNPDSPIPQRYHHVPLTSGNAAESFNAELHKARRFIMQFDNKSYPWLDSQAVKQAIDSVNERFQGNEMLSKIRDFLQRLALYDRPGKRIARGMLLWGPPGTGKTTIIELLARMSGMTLVTLPFAGGMINSSKVGDTEKILSELAFRGKFLPWAPCCLAIDECDSVAPDRNVKASEHKVDALSVLLSVFGGIQDVPNLFIFGSTNRMRDMDPAFLRRMDGKFYIGLPDPEARKDILKPVRAQVAMLNNLVTATTNFSGGNMAKLVSELVTRQQGFKRGGAINPAPIISVDAKPQNELTISEALEAVRDICVLEDIYCGDKFLPDYLRVLGGDPKLVPTLVYHLTATLRDPAFPPTGRVFIHIVAASDNGSAVQAAQPYEISIERRRRGKYESELSCQSLSDPNTTMSQMDIFERLISVAATFAVDTSVKATFLQIVTASSLYRKGVYEENDMIKFVNDLVEESTFYNRSMLIFELESLVLVEQEDTATFNQSEPKYRVIRPKLMHYIFALTQKHAIFRTDQQLWIWVVSTHPHLSTKFKQALHWPLTPEESAFKQQQAAAQESKVECYFCGEMFSEAESDASSTGAGGGGNECNYHNDRLAPHAPVELILNRQLRPNPPRVNANATATSAIPTRDEPEFKEEKIGVGSFQNISYRMRLGLLTAGMSNYKWSVKDKAEAVWSCCGGRGIWDRGCQHERQHRPNPSSIKAQPQQTIFAPQRVQPSQPLQATQSQPIPTQPLPQSAQPFVAPEGKRETPEELCIMFLRTRMTRDGYKIVRGDTPLTSKNVSEAEIRAVVSDADGDYDDQKCFMRLMALVRKRSHVPA